MAELITLKRSNASKKFAIMQNMTIGNYVNYGKRHFLKKMILKEQPEMKQPLETSEGQFWQIEKQFWLKYKSLFQDMGFLPLDVMNPVTGKPYMLEKF